eukprot:2241189-Prorocentrum_lima.AAC.1
MEETNIRASAYIKTCWVGKGLRMLAFEHQMFGEPTATHTLEDEVARPFQDCRNMVESITRNYHRA